MTSTVHQQPDAGPSTTRHIRSKQPIGSDGDIDKDLPVTKIDPVAGLPPLSTLQAWSHRPQAVTRCCISDVYTMRALASQNVGYQSRDVFLLNRWPCRMVCLVAWVAGVDHKETQMVLTLDDGDGQHVLPVTIRLPKVMTRPRSRLPNHTESPKTLEGNASSSRSSSSYPALTTRTDPVNPSTSTEGSKSTEDTIRTTTDNTIFLSAKERKARRKAAALAQEEAEEASTSRASDYIYQGPKAKIKAQCTSESYASSHFRSNPKSNGLGKGKAEFVPPTKIYQRKDIQVGDVVRVIGRVEEWFRKSAGGIALGVGGVNRAGAGGEYVRGVVVDEGAGGSIEVVDPDLQYAHLAQVEELHRTRYSVPFVIPPLTSTTNPTMPIPGTTDPKAALSTSNTVSRQGQFKPTSPFHSPARSNTSDFIQTPRVVAESRPNQHAQQRRTQNRTDDPCAEREQQSQGFSIAESTTQLSSWIEPSSEIGSEMSVDGDEVRLCDPSRLRSSQLTERTFKTYLQDHLVQSTIVRIREIQLESGIRGVEKALEGVFPEYKASNLVTRREKSSSRASATPGGEAGAGARAGTRGGHGMMGNGLGHPGRVTMRNTPSSDCEHAGSSSHIRVLHSQSSRVPIKSVLKSNSSRINIPCDISTPKSINRNLGQGGATTPTPTRSTFRSKAERERDAAMKLDSGFTATPVSKTTSAGRHPYRPDCSESIHRQNGSPSSSTRLTSWEILDLSRSISDIPDQSAFASPSNTHNARYKSNSGGKIEPFTIPSLLSTPHLQTLAKLIVDETTRKEEKRRRLRIKEGIATAKDLEIERARRARTGDKSAREHARRCHDKHVAGSRSVDRARDGVATLDGRDARKRDWELTDDEREKAVKRLMEWGVRAISGDGGLVQVQVKADSEVEGDIDRAQRAVAWTPGYLPLPPSLLLPLLLPHMYTTSTARLRPESLGSYTSSSSNLRKGSRRDTGDTLDDNASATTEEILQRLRRWGEEGRWERVESWVVDDALVEGERLAVVERAGRGWRIVDSR